MTSEEKAAELGAEPLARVVASGVAGVDPAYMGIGPVPAIRSALDAAGLELAEIDLIEINEAFAAQVLACVRELGIDRGAAQRQRRRDRPRPPARLLGRAADHRPRLGAAAAQRPLRHRGPLRGGGSRPRHDHREPDDLGSRCATRTRGAVGRREILRGRCRRRTQPSPTRTPPAQSRNRSCCECRSCWTSPLLVWRTCRRSPHCGGDSSPGRCGAVSTPFPGTTSRSRCWPTASFSRPWTRRYLTSRDARPAPWSRRTGYLPSDLAAREDQAAGHLLSGRMEAGPRSRRAVGVAEDVGGERRGGPPTRRGVCSMGHAPSRSLTCLSCSARVGSTTSTP